MKIKINGKLINVSDPSPRSMAQPAGWRAYLGRGIKSALRSTKRGYCYAISLAGPSLADAQEQLVSLRAGQTIQIEFITPNGYHGWHSNQVIQ